LLFSLATASVARSAGIPPGDTQSSHAQPVNTTQLAAWLIGGVPSSHLARLVAERGLATLPTKSELRQMESAGANQDLMTVLSSGNVQSARVGAPIPQGLLKAATEARQQRFHEAEADLREVLGVGTPAADSQDSALHFALGVMYRQQEK